MIEMMARAIYDAELAAERKGPISDATWSSIWSSPRNMIRRHYETLARAALSVLAANVSDEMVEAFKDKMEPYTDGSGFNYKAALAAAISAAGDEDRIA